MDTYEPFEGRDTWPHTLRPGWVVDIPDHEDPSEART